MLLFTINPLFYENQLQKSVTNLIFLFILLCRKNDKLKQYDFYFNKTFEDLHGLRRGISHNFCFRFCCVGAAVGADASAVFQSYYRKYAFMERKRRQS